MGCDIHMFLQTRKTQQSEWITGEELSMGRDYELFDMIANVRGDHYHRISQAVPYWGEVVKIGDYTVPVEFGQDVINRVTKNLDADYYDDQFYIGEHSFCTLTPADFFQYRHFHEIHEEYHRRKLGEILMAMLCATKSSKNVRCIIGFDS